MKARTVRPRSLGLLGLALLLSTIHSVGVAKEQSRPPDLSGNWKLNEQKSQSLEAAMERMGPPQMMGGGPPGGGPMGGGPMGGGPDMGGGMGPPPGMRGGPGPDSEMDLTRDPIMRALARPPMMFVIEQSDSKVVLTESGRQLRTVFLRPKDDQEFRGLEQMGGRWKGERLETEGKSADGRKLRERYWLSKDGQSLTVAVKGQGPGGRSIELERVYERYAGDPH